MTDQPFTTTADVIARIESLLALGRDEEAAAMATTAITHEPDNADLHVLHSSAIVDVDPKRSLASAERAVALAPDRPAPLEALVRAQWRRRRYDDALESVARLKEMSPMRAHAHSWHAGILLSKHGAPSDNTLAEAEAAARRGVRLAPSWPTGHGLLAQVLFAADRLPEAQEEAEKTLELDPDNAMGHKLLGDIHKKRGDVRQASESYVAAGRADPDSGATDRLRKLQAPALLAGGFATYLFRTGLRIPRIDSSTMAVVVAVIVGVTLIVWYAWRQDNAKKTRSEMSEEARRILELDDAVSSSKRRRRS